MARCNGYFEPICFSSTDRFILFWEFIYVIICKVPCTIMIETCLVWDSLVLITNTFWKKEKKNSFRKFLFIYLSIWYIEIKMKYQPTNWFGLCACFFVNFFLVFKTISQKIKSNAILKSESALFSKKNSRFLFHTRIDQGNYLKERRWDRRRYGKRREKKKEMKG